MTAHQNICRYNIDDIRLTPSPMDIQPLKFQAGSVIESATFERIRTSVYNKPKKTMIEEEEEEEKEQDPDDILDQE